MGKLNAGASKLILLGALVSLATPVHAAQVIVSANAGHFLQFENGSLSNQSVYTDQHSIENTLPSSGGAPGALVRRDNGVVTSGPGSPATFLTVAASEPASVAYAYGDLAAGKVGAYAGTGATGFSSSSVIISDTLTFNVAGAGAGAITPCGCWCRCTPLRRTPSEISISVWGRAASCGLERSTSHTMALQRDGASQARGSKALPATLISPWILLAPVPPSASP